MIHYTDVGMIPFDQQLSNYHITQEAKKLEMQAEEKLKPKESWDHGVDENISAVSTKAIKVTKLGKKK